MKIPSVTVTRANVAAGLAALFDALEPADVDAIERAGERLGALADMLRGASVGKAAPPAEPAPSPGAWTEPPDLLRDLLAALERIPSAAWAVARRLDVSKRDVDAIVLRNLHLFKTMKDHRAIIELSDAGRSQLALLRSRSETTTDGAAQRTAAA